MPTDQLAPAHSDTPTPQEAADYDAWLRAKVAASLADPRPAIPHDEVERRMTERFAQLRQKQNQA